MSTPKPEEKNELVLEIHAGLIKDLLATILVIEDGEFKLKTTKDWVSYCGVDPSHVCMAGFDVPTIKLKTWRKNSEIMLDASKLRNILRGTKAKSYGTITKGDFGYDKVRIYAKVVKQGDVTDPKAPPKSVNMSIIEVETDVGRTTIHMPSIDPCGIADPKIPDLILTASITVNTDALRRALTVLSAFADHVAFELHPDKDDAKCRFILGAGSCDRCDCERFEAVLNEVVYNKKPEGPIRALYPLDYLTSILKAIKSKTVTIMYSNDYPCKINYLLDGSFDAFFLLAPRIENV